MDNVQYFIWGWFFKIQVRPSKLSFQVNTNHKLSKSNKQSVPSISIESLIKQLRNIRWLCLIWTENIFRELLLNRQQLSRHILWSNELVSGYCPFKALSLNNYSIQINLQLIKYFRGCWRCDIFLANSFCSFNWPFFWIQVFYFILEATLFG